VSAAIQVAHLAKRFGEVTAALICVKPAPRGGG